MKINYKSQFTNYNEKRSHPELNPFISAWDYVDKYKDDPEVYISFTEIDKIGLNPQSTYNTPLGIYTYPLKEFVDNYIVWEHLRPSEKIKNSVGFYAPFAGGAKYINFIRVKDKSHFINDMYTDYTSKNYDRDIKILKSIKKYKLVPDKYISDCYVKLYELDEKVGNLSYNEMEKICYSLAKQKYDFGLYNDVRDFIGTMIEVINDYILEDIKDIKGIIKKLERYNTILTDSFLNEAISTAKEKNPIMIMWNITRMLANVLSNFNNREGAVQWNLILSKDLGYSGFADKSGKGYIHPSEPMQAVFLNTRAFTLLHRVENTKAKSVASNKDIIIRKLMDIAMIGEEHKEDFELNLLFSKDEKKIIRYKGNFRIEKINVKEMPYQIEEIDGSFYAKNVKLTSFKNFPIEVKKDLYLVDLPYIDSLKGITEFVHGDLFIDKNLLDIFGEKQIRSKCNIKGDIIIY